VIRAFIDGLLVTEVNSLGYVLLKYEGVILLETCVNFIYSYEVM
jgi:hypothetical protein